MKITKKILSLALICCMIVSMTACSSLTGNKSNYENDNAVNKEYDGQLVYDHSTELNYAKRFSVDYYKGGYKKISIVDNLTVLIVPEGMSVPKDLDKDICVMQQPISNLFISSTPTISLLDSIGCLEAVSLTTTDVDTWYIENVKTLMKDGKIQYVGDYNELDYEKIAASGTEFTMFSGMLPEDITAKLNQIGVNVMLDKSSEEDHPLARVEWVKLYGAMFNKEAEAEKVYQEQLKLVKSIEEKEKSDKTVAIFYITSTGSLYARNSEDYMAKMVKLAGANYVLDGKVGVGKTGTTKMEMESFYNEVKDVDYIVYIWTMGGKPSTLDDFKAKSPILSDIKAVKDGNVWCTTPDFFQISNTIGVIVNDMNLMVNSDGSADKFTYLYKLK